MRIYIVINSIRVIVILSGCSARPLQASGRPPYTPSGMRQWVHAVRDGYERRADEESRVEAGRIRPGRARSSTAGRGAGEESREEGRQAQEGARSEEEYKQAQEALSFRLVLTTKPPSTAQFINEHHHHHQRH